jgi:hypothetical protein
MRSRSIHGCRANQSAAAIVSSYGFVAQSGLMESAKA